MKEVSKNEGAGVPLPFNFCQNLQILPSPGVFCTHAEGEWRWGSKKTMVMPLPDHPISVMICEFI